MNVNNINPYQGLQNAFRPDGGNGGVADNGEVASASSGQSNLAVVYDPPFFPIARYQRQDLIKKAGIKGEIEVKQSGADQELQPNTHLDNKSKADATETIRVATSGAIQPGKILTVTI
jgi:hypothetical protein